VTIKQSALTSDDRLRVGELARRTGKTTRALRFYEEMGLLTPIRRTKGGFREYDAHALVRIHWIDRLQELGFSLSETRDFLSRLREIESGPAAMDELRAFYARQLIETRHAISRLKSLDAELKHSLLYLESCQSCAPSTPRSSCPVCSDSAHQGEVIPTLVAAIHDPVPPGDPFFDSP
jgi:DNA-binding transcriptional MerR regulator